MLERKPELGEVGAGHLVSAAAADDLMRHDVYRLPSRERLPCHLTGRVVFAGDAAPAGTLLKAGQPIVRWSAP